jgi:hypothetical protein
MLECGTRNPAAVNSSPMAVNESRTSPLNLPAKCVSAATKKRPMWTHSGVMSAVRPGIRVFDMVRSEERLTSISPNALPKIVLSASGASVCAMSYAASVALSAYTAESAHVDGGRILCRDVCRARATPKADRPSHVDHEQFLPSNLERDGNVEDCRKQVGVATTLAHRRCTCASAYPHTKDEGHQLVCRSGPVIALCRLSATPSTST